MRPQRALGGRSAPCPPPAVRAPPLPAQNSHPIPAARLIRKQKSSWHGICTTLVCLSSPNLCQRVVKIRRDYNSWVASETMEDYALRFTPQRFRKWSEWRVANTAFGAASFLVLEAVGATLLVQYGFVNAFWAILATGLIIFLAGCPSACTPRATGWTWTC
jgi:hypothetical protein